MKKTLFLLSLILLLNSCAESIALLSSGASNGRIVQSSLNSAISYGIKKQTGKTPLEHAITYAEEKNPERKKDTCISSIEATKSEVCTIVKKQILQTNIVLKEKTSEILHKFPRELSLKLQTKIKEPSLIEKIAKRSIIYNRR